MRSQYRKVSSNRQEKVAEGHAHDAGLGEKVGEKNKEGRMSRLVAIKNKGLVHTEEPGDQEGIARLGKEEPEGKRKKTNLGTEKTRQREHYLEET